MAFSKYLRPVLSLLLMLAVLACQNSGKETPSEKATEDIGCIPRSDGGKKPEETRKSINRLPQSLTADDGREITMLVVYTHAAKQHFDEQHRDINTAIDNAIKQANEAFSFSSIDLAVRTVYRAEVGYKEADTFSDDLDQIRDTDAGSEIRALQDRNAADMVTVIRNDGDMAGIAFMLQNNGLDYSDSGIEVIRWSCVDDGLRCLAHELGHLLGIAHDRPNVDFYGWSKLYSFGYCFRANDGFLHGDLLAYACADRRETLFSDPLARFKVRPDDAGVPTGVPETNSGGATNPKAADGARTIRETKMLVANHRRKP